MTTPKLKSINGLFGLTDSQNSQTTYQADLFIEQLKPFHDHPFSLHTGERLDDLVDSIRVNGVMQPIIVQPKGRFYEILAGHNRANAAKLAGLETIPAVIVADLSEEEALAYVIESNMMQRSFSELRYSEKAAVISLQHGKMFFQGKRSDIQAALLELTEGQKKGASSVDKTKLRTNEHIASQYDLSKNTIARYLRISKLCISLKEKLDEGRIAFTSAVNVSFLTEEEQECLNECLSENNQKLDLHKTEQLRASSKEGNLTRERMLEILNGENSLQKNRKKQIAIPREWMDTYFQNGEDEEEILQTIQSALSHYFNQ